MVSFILKSLKCLLNGFNNDIKLTGNKYIYCKDLLDKGNYWIILRCSKCKTKSIPIISNERILSANKYCRYCGSEDYYIEKKDKIERIDTIYALFSQDLIEVKEEMVNYKKLKLNNDFLKTLITQRNDSFEAI